MSEPYIEARRILDSSEARQILHYFESKGLHRSASYDELVDFIVRDRTRRDRTRRDIEKILEIMIHSGLLLRTTSRTAYHSNTHLSRLKKVLKYRWRYYYHVNWNMLGVLRKGIPEYTKSELDSQIIARRLFEDMNGKRHIFRRTKRGYFKAGGSDIKVIEFDNIPIDRIEPIDLVNSPEVNVQTEGKGEEEKQVIDIDYKNLEEGKVYRVDYQGEAYGVEKQPDGKLVFYEVMG